MKFFISLLILISLSPNIYSHPGKLAKDGCHKEKGKERHCHPERSNIASPLTAVSTKALETENFQNSGQVIQESKEVYKILNDGFTVWVDCDKRLPFKFQYNAQRDHGNKKRKKNFSVDPRLPRHCNQLSSDAYGLDFDRGHLVPANHLDHSDLALTQSNYMSNITPQNKTMNRGAWMHTETLTECYRDKEELLVIGGALWLNNSNEYLKKHGVNVPSHFWKVIIKGIGENESYQAWLIPNISEAQEKNIQKYQVNIFQLEKITMQQIPFTTNKKGQMYPKWEMPKNCDRS